MKYFDPKTGQLDLVHAPDEVKIEIKQFNRRVITESFNRVVCNKLAQYIDPSFREKTLIFCVTDDHADMVVNLLKEAFKKEYGYVETGYGDAEKPEDYLNSFRSYIAENMNKIPALMLVTQRPRDLTRAQLKPLKLELDTAGYPEKHLQVAWRESTNEDIAASIIGFIRQAALGDALISHEARVDRAMNKILASRNWKPPQRKWLERIGKQLK